jgi:hypothetical protein
MYWNYHQVRSQAEKDMPSGHVPIDAIENPQLYGASNCLIPVPKDAVAHLREFLVEEVGSRSKNLDWVNEEFSTMADNVYQSIGKPVILFTNSWEVFSKMSRVIGALLLE